MQCYSNKNHGVWQWVGKVGVDTDRSLKFLEAFGSGERRAKEKLLLESGNKMAHVLWKQRV